MGPPSGFLLSIWLDLLLLLPWLQVIGGSAWTWSLLLSPPSLKSLQQAIPRRRSQRKQKVHLPITRTQHLFALKLRGWGWGLAEVISDLNSDWGVFNLRHWGICPFPGVSRALTPLIGPQHERLCFFFTGEISSVTAAPTGEHLRCTLHLGLLEILPLHGPHC